MLHNLIEVSIGELTVKPLHQRHPVFTGKMVVPDLLGSVIGRTADSEFNKGRVIMEIVDLVINAVVLAKSSLSSKGTSGEPAVLYCEIIAFLGSPFNIIAW